MSEFKDIYKFRSISLNSLVSLSSNKIWFASKHDLNDPFEGYIYISEPSDKAEKIVQYTRLGQEIIAKRDDMSSDIAREIVLSRYLSDPDGFLSFVDNLLKEHQETISSGQAAFGIYSVSSDMPGSDITQESNMLMWSHYADGFKGFCIQYDLRSLYASLQSLNQNTKFAWCAVDYLEKPHKVSMVSDIGNGTLEAFKAIQCKHEQWSYECEIRLVSSKTGSFSISPSAVKTIYIGGRMPQEQRELLISTVRRSIPDCAMKIVSIANGLDKYAVHVNEI